MLNPPQTLREKAAQLVFVRLGSNMSPPIAAEDDAARVVSLMERCPIGGLVLFNGAWPQTARTLAALQEHSRYPLLVGADVERGVGPHVEGATTFPHARAFAALGGDAADAVHTFAQMTALEARACGIHWAFAPVADVNVNPANPIIGPRAYGDEPSMVRPLVEAFIQGAKAGGLLTTAKHFPGHGRTATDSHAELPVVTAARDELEQVDWPPFGAAIEAGVDSMMTAHVAYPALDPVRRPATSSSPILRDLLRGEMSFEGVVVSDSLVMEGAASPADAGEHAAALIEAGVDVLLDPVDPEAVVDGLVQAVEHGRLAEDRIEAAFQRVWQLKLRWAERAGEEAFAPSDTADASPVGAPAHRAHAERVARQAVTVVDGAVETATLAHPQRVLVVRMGRKANTETSTLHDAARVVWPQAQYEDAPPDLTPDRMKDIEHCARRVDHVVLALIATPAAWQSVGLSAAQTMLMRTLVTAHPTTVAALGSSHVLADVPAEARAQLCTFSDVPAAQQALMEFLSEPTDG